MGFASKEISQEPQCCFHPKPQVRPKQQLQKLLFANIINHTKMVCCSRYRQVQAIYKSFRETLITVFIKAKL